MAPQDVCLVNTDLGCSHSLLVRVRGEYLEMPGLRLSPAQARRLWGLELSECQRVLDDLVGSGFLKRTAEGFYQRN